MLASSSVDLVEWESRIIQDVDDALPQEEASTSTTTTRARSTNAAVASGKWVDRVRWDDDDDDTTNSSSSSSDVEIIGPLSLFGRKRVRSEKTLVAWVEPPSRPAEKKYRPRRTIPRAPHSVPAQLHRFVSTDPTPAQQLFFHRPRLPKGYLERTWILSPPDEQPRSRRKSSSAVGTEDLRASDGQLLVLEFSEEFPSLVANAGMASTLIRFGDSDVDDVTITLGEGDYSPVWGAWDDGDHAVCSDLLRAPVVFHEPPDHLFLLVLKPAKKKGDGPLEWTIRERSRLGVLGQIEPQRAVSAPGNKPFKAIQEPFAAFAIARTLGQAAQSKNPQVRELCRVGPEDLKDALFKNTKIHLALVKRAAQTARGELSARKNKDSGLAEADDLATRFSPEDVCAYESANAFAMRLQALGLQGLPSALKDEQGAHQAVAAMYRRLEAARARARALRSKIATFAAISADFEAEVVVPAEARAKELDREWRVARRVHEELVFSPANLSEGFVARTVLKLSGLGDPSGTGDAFCFQRKRVKGGFRDYNAYMDRVKNIARKQKMVLSKTSTTAAALPEEEEEEEEEERRGQTTAAAAAEEESDHSLSDLEKEIEEGVEERPVAGSEADERRELAKLREQRAAEQRAREEARRATIQQPNRPKYAVRRVRRVVDQGRERVVVDLDVRPAEVARVAKATNFQIPDAKQQQQQPQQPQPSSEERIDDLLDDLGLEEEYQQMDQFWLGLDVDQQPKQQQQAPPAPRGGARTSATQPTVAPPSGGAGRGKGKSKSLMVKLSRSAAADEQAPVVKKKPRARASAAPSVPGDGGPRVLPSLKITTLQRKYDEHKANERLKKAEKHREEAAAYHRRSKPTKKPRAASASRDRLPHIRLAKLLDDRVLLPVFRRPLSGPFHKPVPVKKVPGYKDKIKQPIDLSTIRERLTRAFVYRKRQDLLAALELMAANARLFNGANHALALEADAILDQARAACDEISDDLDVLEKETQDHTAQATTRRKRPPPKKADPPSPPMPMPPTTPIAPMPMPPTTPLAPLPTDDDAAAASSSSGEEEVLEVEMALDQL
ncbi:hypothetical protein CTAYLR_006275 [Chrysophaeum taylorii]|uniref:Bromo domain-containing protein n=1 Tax=Chrysophaeum taylorii TaxID=2483200 RepID=A0AAD7ULN7_9STRA|nr:hypothetical protein CTAYLR_006275 [Chrysophaeum taylorii]